MFLEGKPNVVDKDIFMSDQNSGYASVISQADPILRLAFGDNN